MYCAIIFISRKLILIQSLKPVKIVFENNRLHWNLYITKKTKQKLFEQNHKYKTIIFFFSFAIYDILFNKVILLQFKTSLKTK